MLWNYLTLLRDVQWDDLLDIGLAAVLLWVGIHALRSTRMRGVGAGLLLFGLLFLTARQLELKLTVWMLQGITAAIVLVIVVVYQDEIRRMLQRLPGMILPAAGRHGEAAADVAGLVAEAAAQLSAERRGALLVLPGNDPLEGVVSEGVPLDGRPSRALLLSLFDPHSPGHDGALILRGDRIERFGARLPLSSQEEPLRDRGTRHAAALGLAERSDALVLVVSEESGRVSLARNGRLRVLDGSDQVAREVETFLQAHAAPGKRTGRVRHLSWQNGLEGCFALLLAACLWLVLVPGSVVETSTYEIPIEVQNIPEGYVLLEVSPAKVTVILSGERRDLFHVRAEDLAIRLDGTLTGLGRRTFSITPSHLLLPPGVEVADLVPEQARISVHRTEGHP